LNKPLIATTLLAAGTLGTGYVIGQIAGVSPSFAAGGTHTHSLRTNVANQPAGAHADGQIAAINGDSITVTPDANRAGSNEYTGVTTINLTSATKYAAGHDAAATATRLAFTVGQHIVAEGTVSSDGKTLSATLVSVDAGGHGPGGPGHMSGPHADGMVTAVNGDTISLKADADQAGSNEDAAVTSVVLTSATTYDAGHDSASSTTKPSITAGEYLIAEGTLSNGGATLTATRVSIRPSGLGGH